MLFARDCAKRFLRSSSGGKYIGMREEGNGPDDV